MRDNPLFLIAAMLLKSVGLMAAIMLTMLVISAMFAAAPFHTVALCGVCVAFGGKVLNDRLEEFERASERLPS